MSRLIGELLKCNMSACAKFKQKTNKTNSYEHTMSNLLIVELWKIGTVEERFLFYDHELTAAGSCSSDTIELVVS